MPLPTAAPTATAEPQPTPEPTPTAEPQPTPEPLPPLFPDTLPVFPTATPSPAPPSHTADDCKNGGWMDLGYLNQGQCIAAARSPPFSIRNSPRPDA